MGNMSEKNPLLTRGVAEVIELESIKSKLASGKRLLVKLGIDPTNPQLHIGHYLVLQKLREFQDRNDQAMLVIGDFTARVGDPSGRDRKRQSLSKAEISENMRRYKEQAGKIIDVRSAKIVYNSTWFDKLGVEGILELASKATYSQIMERKEFRNRLKRENLSLLETFYPLLQAYDSVMLKADIEIGGVDQKLNLLMGRQIQKRYGQGQQDIILTPLLVGLDGKEKMSKTAGNFVAFEDAPEEMFGKIMSISDSLVVDYFNYCTRFPMEKMGAMPPIDIKKKLAYEIVKIYHGQAAAEKAKNEFERVFQEGGAPSARKIILKQKVASLVDFLVEAGLAVSKSEARRLILQGGVEVDGEKVSSPTEEITLKNGTFIKVGKLKAVEVMTEG